MAYYCKMLQIYLENSVYVVYSRNTWETSTNVWVKMVVKYNINLEMLQIATSDQNIYKSFLEK